MKTSNVSFFVVALALCGCAEVGNVFTSGAGGVGGGQGGSTSTGAQGGTGAGGSGGSTTGSGGAGGQGGACAPTFACGHYDCGTVDDGCGNLLDCDWSYTGAPTSCSAQGDGTSGGPMECTQEHVCACQPEGNTEDAMLFCEGTAAEPTVNSFCVNGGGCDTALCGIPPVPKAPPTCIYSGRTLKPVPLDESTWIHIWCCVNPT